MQPGRDGSGPGQGAAREVDRAVGDRAGARTVLQLVRACQRENNRAIQEVLQPELIDDSTDQEEA